jgi:hypothetical protein
MGAGCRCAPPVFSARTAMAGARAPSLRATCPQRSAPRATAPARPALSTASGACCTPVPRATSAVANGPASSAPPERVARGQILDVLSRGAPVAATEQPSHLRRPCHHIMTCFREPHGQQRQRVLSSIQDCKACHLLMNPSLASPVFLFDICRELPRPPLKHHSSRGGGAPRGRPQPPTHPPTHSHACTPSIHIKGCLACLQLIHTFDFPRT